MPILAFIIVYCSISFIIVAPAMKDSYGGKGKLWILWIPFSPFLLLFFIIGSMTNK